MRDKYYVIDAEDKEEARIAATLKLHDELKQNGAAGNVKQTYVDGFQEIPNDKLYFW
jgi:hypothetical protein